MSARRVVAAAGLAPAAADAVGLAGRGRSCEDLRGDAGKIELHRLRRGGVVVQGVMLDDCDGGGGLAGRRRG